MHETIEEVDYLLSLIYEAHWSDRGDDGSYWDLHLVCDDEDMWLVKHRHSERIFIQSQHIQTISDALSGVVEYLTEVGKL